MLSIGLLVLRVVVGLTVAGHGAQKLFGWFEGPGIAGFSGALASLGIKPERPWAILAGLAEFAGGVLVATGFLTPIGALTVCGSMITAILFVHWSKGFWATKGGFEFPLTIMAVMVALSITGPGAFSLDQALRVALPEPATWLVMAVLVVLGVVAALVLVRGPRAHAPVEAQPQPSPA
jgi:putative oxidoreductase